MMLSLRRTCEMFRGLSFPLIVAGLLVARPAQAQQVREFSLNGLGHFLGSSAAPVLIVEFADFGCPNCARFNVDVFPRIEAAYINTKIVRWKVIPWSSNYFPNSREAAEAIECAAEQGAFWQMHDRMYESRGALSRQDLIAHAGELGLDAGRVAAELDSSVHAPRVQRDLDSGLASGVTGTPTFFVGGRLHAGSFDAASLIAALELSA